MYWKPFLDTAYQLENKQGDIEQLLVGQNNRERFHNLKYIGHMLFFLLQCSCNGPVSALRSSIYVFLN